LLVIGGSHLFHAASLWALEISSKIVDMVFYASVPENNQIVHEAKELFHNGIVVSREHIEDYVDEADCILIGPGMVRTSDEELKTENLELRTIEEVNQFTDEGVQTYYLTKYLLTNYPHKKWVIDAGALQMMRPEWLGPLGGNVILTPHPQEMARVFHSRIKKQELRIKEEDVQEIAREYGCTILLKGEEDVVCSPDRCVRVSGGNAGMTKGGTGDVLAGLVASLACKNELFLAATAGSYINKKAGEALFEKVGYYFNSSDLVQEIPAVMKKLLL
jgi:NAD(P)H-hydrate epimerase